MRTPSKKRSRNKSSPEGLRVAKKQTFIKDYWLCNESTIPTSNLFEKLSQTETQGVTEERSGAPQEVRAPAIFVSGVQNIKPLQELLDEKAIGCYTFKILNNNQVKIQINKSEKYLPIITALKEKNTEFFTYQKKDSRKFKVVLRNLHLSVDHQDIINELKTKGHNVCRISNIKHKSSKEPLPLFFIELESKDNNKDIYKIDLLVNSKVIFEQPYKKREIPQCIRCQQYGHTKSYCNKSPRCVKCALNHWTQNCPKKERSDDVVCVNCGENHPANYKGCTVYKQLRQRMFPALRRKDAGEVSPGDGNQPSKPTQSGNMVQPGISYARCVKGTPVQPQEVNLNTTETSRKRVERLEEMIMALITKMDSMFNLLSTMIAKMP